MTMLWAVALLWAVVAAAFSGVALWRVLKGGPKGGTRPRWPKVLLLRPLDQPSPLELENLSAPVDYPGPLRQVVLSPYRPRRLAGVEWLYSDPPTRNRKVGHLVYGAEVLTEGDEVVLAVDADVRVDGALVEALVEPLLGGADLSCAAPAPSPGHTPAARALRALLCNTHHSFRALDAMSAGAKAVCGKALGLGRPALSLLGGLTDCIGEDLELSTRLHQDGRTVVLAAAVAHVPQERAPQAAAVLDRFTRWMQVLRAHRPELYPTVPLLFAPTFPLLGAAVLLGDAWLWGAMAVLLVTRSALSVALEPSRPRRGEAVGAWLWGELLLLAAFVRSVGRRVVTWRGRSFELLPGGKLSAAVYPGVER